MALFFRKEEAEDLPLLHRLHAESAADGTVDAPGKRHDGPPLGKADGDGFT
jgi:hypothetical protein